MSINHQNPKRDNLLLVTGFQKHLLAVARTLADLQGQLSGRSVGELSCLVHPLFHEHLILFLVHINTYFTNTVHLNYQPNQLPPPLRPSLQLLASIASGKSLSQEYFQKKLPLPSTMQEEQHCGKNVRVRSFSGPYSVRMQENKDQKNTEYGHFLRSAGTIKTYELT